MNQHAPARQPGPLPRRVLVTGASGGIGRPTVGHLLAHGIAVTAVAVDESAPWPSPVRYLTLDATDEIAMGQAMDGCDAVVHLAALAHPSLGTPLRVFGNNVISTFTVLALAARHGIGRVVIASSINASGVNLNPHQPLPAYFPLDEQLPADLADAYSLSKQVDELSAATAARAWGTDVVALRFPLVKTRDQLHAIRAEVTRDPVSMVRTGWAYLTDHDAARAVLAALRAPLSGAHVVGLSAADTLLPRPTEELLDAYAPTVPRRRGFVGHEALVDTARAQQVLGFTPRQSVHEPVAAAHAGRHPGRDD
ncbi:NAD(P)-dependent oxidoreductase [Rugosimonospora acidiphila]|uniref:NAD(P)-dependent oxidoreductase n=1 Tax=Rugosimonospora acidiphila TaxID=556531 RepID=A0ABP9SAA4_9ACTN